MIDNELNQAFHLVAQANNNQIKEGEAKLAYLRKDSNYPINLLYYINNNQDPQYQLRAAIELKLWCTSYEVILYLSPGIVSLLKNFLSASHRISQVPNRSCLSCPSQ